MKNVHPLDDFSIRQHASASLDQFSTPIRGRVIIACLLLIFLIAIPLDTPLSNLAHECGSAAFLRDHERLAHCIRLPGNFNFTLLPVLGLLLAAWYKRQSTGGEYLQKATLVFLAGVFSGMNAVMKFAIGRSRPFHGIPLYELHPFKGGLHGQRMAEMTLSFPSGDASCAFALSVSLSMVLPRFWPIWWLLALVVAVERIAENSHYPTDVVGGLAVGVLSALLARKLTRWLFLKYKNTADIS